MLYSVHCLCIFVPLTRGCPKSKGCRADHHPRWPVSKAQSLAMKSTWTKYAMCSFQMCPAGLHCRDLMFPNSNYILQKATTELVGDIGEPEVKMERTMRTRSTQYRFYIAWQRAGLQKNFLLLGKHWKRLESGPFVLICDSQGSCQARFK